MYFNPLSQSDRFEKAKILAKRIIVNALQSERGDIIRAMNVADLENMVESVVRAVYNKLTVKAQIAYGYKIDYVIEEDVSAYFEINGKLQYREMSRPIIIYSG